MLVQLSKGRQITIPAEIRDELELHAGSKIEVIVKNKEIVLKPLGDDLEKLFAEAKNQKPKHGLTAKQMDELNEGLMR
ncbi:AbrB/MazE/SpoVT family DNA-binding domain-containing protein [Candidatus Woesearchaeota archaeon]|nr:AbrB/MazE/SpoVT family DNA-binding domain-containing protein [Candidatus Woesearchaeota archaeon]